ncbi:transmembrane protein 92 isoform X2 [Ambystoma mexicanum]|uniref:transmembrane protein 92 isoform X2 n=1 Tax=Ambystoma mexicanum TaxID=8296 RepID=UPI0037E6FF67
MTMLLHLGASRSAPNLHTKLLLVAAFGSYPTVALHCGIFECTGDYCCNGQCCIRDKIYLDNSWYGPLFISIMVAFAFMCLCGLCNRLCRSSVERRAQDVESRHPQESPVSPTYSGASPLPVLPQENYGQPPPYSEFGILMWQIIVTFRFSHKLKEKLLFWIR